MIELTIFGRGFQIGRLRPWWRMGTIGELTDRIASTVAYLSRLDSQSMVATGSDPRWEVSVMRVPRVPFTIGRLMLAVLLLGLALWGRREIQLRQLNQAILVSRAQAAYQQARLVREVAEYAVMEYEQGIKPEERSPGPSQIDVAGFDKVRLLDRLPWLTEMGGGSFSKASIIADKLVMEQADLQRAQLSNVLEYSARQTHLKSLKIDVEKAKADENAKLAAYQFERARRLSLLGF